MVFWVMQVVLAVTGTTTKCEGMAAAQGPEDGNDYRMPLAQERIELVLGERAFGLRQIRLTSEKHNSIGDVFGGTTNGSTDRLVLLHAYAVVDLVGENATLVFTAGDWQDFVLATNIA